jgi:hypothetical protein
MTLRFKTNLLEHSKAIAAWSKSNNAKSFIDVTSMALAVQLNKRTIQFTAQYVGTRPDGALAYFSQLGENCNGFVGWLPYAMQQWPLSSSKTFFKSQMTQLALHTPQRWDSINNIDQAYLVKQDKSSFGYGIRGPYAANASQVPLKPGEFAEGFKEGRIARAWYWGAKLAVLEIFPMPKVVGDGRSTFTELVRTSIGADAQLPNGLDEISRYQGFEPETIIPAGRSLMADFRYVSPLNPTVYKNHNCLSQPLSQKLRRSFEGAGRDVWPLIETNAKTPMVFVLDAIVDSQDDTWFLEINSNAQLHPDLYAVMLSGLFKGAV